jgi:hypothetical protein
MVFSGMILGFIVSKEEKLPNPKKHASTWEFTANLSI